jgi:DUF4097 and DUF4098 domain-containing protein YvlB
MTHIRRIAVGITILLLAAGAGWAADTNETFDKTYPLAAGGRVSVENINGDLHIEVWDRSEVHVVAVKEAESSDALQALDIKVDASANSLSIETKYPSSDGWGFWKHSHGHMQVDYTLTIPRGARVSGVDLVNGSMDVTGVEGGLEAETVNGAIRAQNVRGLVELSTVNGTLEIEYGQLERTDRIHLESVNGTIKLTLPKSTNADVEAETVNGSIRNDFGVEVKKGRWVGSSMRGSIGNGGGEIKLETVNGAIQVNAG